MNIELTATTEEIMNYLWDHEDGLTFRQIFDHFTLEADKTWKRQTLFTHLTILMNKGFILSEGSRRKMIYIPAISRETYREQYAHNVLKQVYDGSLSKFICAFTGHNKLSREEAEELIALLEEQE